jgi:regulator of RNase E activity RraB
MSDDWNFYFCNVEDEFASILLDLGIVDSIPIAELPLVGCIRIYLNSTSDDGKTSSADWEAIDPIETELEDRFALDNTQYVGRVSTSSYRDFYFYLADAESFSASIVDIMFAFPTYRYTVNYSEDREWDLYRSFLYPSPAERQSIENRKVCMALENTGDLMTEPRSIEHWVYFTNQSSCQAFIVDAMERGFTINSQSEPNLEEERDRYSVCIAKIDIPSFQHIDAITLPLFHLAIEHNGQYDGWGCAVVK